jgi:hypothetical protein
MAKRGRPRKNQNFEIEKQSLDVENTEKQEQKYSLDDFIVEKLEKSNQEIQENRVVLTIPEILNAENQENQCINISENTYNIEKLDNQTSFIFSILNFFLAKNNIEVLDDTERQELLLALMQFEFFRLILLRYMKYLVIAKIIGVRVIKLFFKKSENEEEKNQC